jgi:predicted DNA binding protein
MKYVTFSLMTGPEKRHPMHQFIVETDGFEASRLVGSTVTDGLHTAIFHVDGWPPAPYEDALATVETIQEYAISEQTNRTLAVYVREDLRSYDREITDAFGRPGLVTLLPVIYRADGPMEMTLVGPTPTIRTAIDEAPETGVDVRDIGSYQARRIGGQRELTERQAEAVAAAVELGYYDDPRAASVADVGDVLGCAPGTAAEHLRRAERTVMRAHVDEDTTAAAPQ